MLTLIADIASVQKKKKAFSTFTQVSYKKMQYLILANIYA